jgi:hypothetical protein
MHLNNWFGLNHDVFLHVYDVSKLLVPLVVPRFDCLYAVKYLLLYNSSEWLF